MIESANSWQKPHRTKTQVVVIGSGAGGAVVAKEMAELGYQVVVLEQGPYRTNNDFVHYRPRDAFRSLYADGGMTVALGRPGVVLPHGRCVGGTTTINSGTVFRTPDALLRQWQEQLHLSGTGPDTMRPYFQRVEQIIGATEASWHVLSASARAIDRGCKELGLVSGPLTRNAPACAGCGVCTFGCPINAKQSTLVTYVPMASAAGATIWSDAEVTCIRTKRGRVVGVSGHATGDRKQTFDIDADVVVLSGGAIYTPALLQRNRLALSSGQVGENLYLHPAIGVAAVHQDIQDSHLGIPQGYGVTHWQDEGIVLEGGFVPPSLMALQVPGFGDADHAALMQRFRNLLSFGGMVSDKSKGQVRSIAGRNLIRYQLNQRDGRLLALTAKRIGEIFFASGGIEQLLMPIHGHRVINSLAELRAIDINRLPASALDVTAYHPMGTARMSASRRMGVVDANLQSHDIKRLFIADASVFPTSLGVNPQLSIMAFATRLADHLDAHAGELLG